MQGVWFNNHVQLLLKGGGDGGEKAGWLLLPTSYTHPSFA